MGKRYFLYTSRGIVHPNRTDQNTSDEPFAFFLQSVTACPELFTSCCCSACKAAFQSLCVPRAFLFKARNAVGWLICLTGMRGRVCYWLCFPYSGRFVNSRATFIMGRFSMIRSLEMLQSSVTNRLEIIVPVGWALNTNN